MNEAIFFTHALFLLSAILVALRIGKEALAVVISLCFVLANLFVVKQITLFGLGATCSDLYAVGGMITLNLLREYHGKEAAKRAIWLSFGAALLFTLMSVAHLLYQPSEADWAHPFFARILWPMPRLMVASLGVYLLVQRLDLWLFGRISERFTGRSIVLRSGLSTAISQGIDTVLFTLFGLFGLASSLLTIMLLSYAIKLVTLALLIPFTALSKRVVAEQ